MTEWGELTFRIVRIETAGQEVLALAGNFTVARAAFDTSVALYRLTVPILAFPESARQEEHIGIHRTSEDQRLSVV